MSRWRSAAIERLPDYREQIAHAENIMSLWIELILKFGEAYRDPRDEQTIAGIYSFANWCFNAPRQSNAEHDPATAAAIVFYEYIPTCRPAYVDMPRWFHLDEVLSNRAIFSYHIGDSGFEELLRFFRDNGNRSM